MENIKKIKISKIFELQDACFNKNRELIQEESCFVEDCIELIVNRKISKEGYTPEQKEKFQIMHQFLDTALSSLINSLKLLLYGCAGDSLALLRVSFEAVVFQDYALKYDAYDKIKNGVILKSKNRKRLEFEEALKKLEEKEKTDRGRLFGFFANLGSHLTAHRMKYNYFKIENKIYPITAHAILEKDFLQTIINIHMRIALYMVNILSEFYEKIKPEALLDDFFVQSKKLKERYESLK